MPLIDDDGNLFGAVNVIDAIVVVVLLAVVVAGIAVVAALGGGESETRYATIELENQPDYVVERMDEGDVATFDGSEDSITVTDVQITPSPADEGNSSQPDVTIRAEVDGERIEDEDREEDRFQVAGNPLMLGNEIQLNMGTYTTTGTVSDLGQEGETLSDAEATSTTRAAVELENVRPSVADGLGEGMTETMRGETVATVEDVESEPASVVLQSEDGNIYEREHPQNRDVTMVVELQTTETETGIEFRGERLGVGSSIVLNFDGMNVQGEVSAVE
ncbi:DUF4330 family protein [Natronorubrum texcoconense]|uniref:DUF4330 domain-containing protein n=1 Tax=Natronorubrum texcoconense TaxID=1095776 RepID=A0A1G8VR14_9EURY|nr:DUF4330 family protein [Natronorubrum texcoconense]SDJ67835.1 protein of unknown function [Natronorubrum texcoconense]